MYIFGVKWLIPKYQSIYANLQEKLLTTDQSLDELNDSNSLLSQAINSAVKDLEHSVVDPDWFFQTEAYPPPQVPTSNQMVQQQSNYVPPQQPPRLISHQDQAHHYQQQQSRAGQPHLIQPSLTAIQQHQQLK